MAINKAYSIRDVFHLSKSAFEAAKMICAAYGENVVTDRTCRNWFERFRNGDFDLHD